jgi:hypothetical protein
MKEFRIIVASFLRQFNLDFSIFQPLQESGVSQSFMGPFDIISYIHSMVMVRTSSGPKIRKHPGSPFGNCH